MSARHVPFSDYASVRPARVAAVQAFGFTERQARFLTHVLVFSGVFLERQYCQFAGIVHGQKSHDFVARLIRSGFVTPITPGSVRRGRLYHVQFKPLYEAIGEPDNRHRKPATLGRQIARLMVLDAVLADGRYYWLGTERDKVQYFDTALESSPRKETYPQVTYGAGQGATRRFFPHKLPIGVEKDGFRRHVFLYLVTDAVPWPFRQFLFDHAQAFQGCPQWTVRLLMPRRFSTAKAVYRAAFLDQCTRPLDPYLATWLSELRRVPANGPAPLGARGALPRQGVSAVRHDAVARPVPGLAAPGHGGDLDGAVALLPRRGGPPRRTPGVPRPVAPVPAVRRPDRSAEGGATGGQVRNASNWPPSYDQHRP